MSQAWHQGAKTMSTTYSTAQEAIKASAESGEITRCEPTQENLDELRFESDDSADGDEYEFWGADWRVHAART
jgi:hypothetical protein